MAYMAVGSRQVLFSDSYAPSMAGENSREIAVQQDNSQNRTTAQEQTRRTEVDGSPDRTSTGGDGHSVDVLA